MLEFFGNACCYCSVELTEKTLSLDHLIPMNKASLGLHAWGNVVPCCSPCNNEKQQKPWREFLQLKAGISASTRAERIDRFVITMKYDPTLNLHEYADNLYEDVGQVAMTLINLRYKQAEEAIRATLGHST